PGAFLGIGHIAFKCVAAHLCCSAQYVKIDPPRNLLAQSLNLSTSLSEMVNRVVTINGLVTRPPLSCLLASDAGAFCSLSKKHRRVRLCVRRLLEFPRRSRASAISSSSLSSAL